MKRNNLLDLFRAILTIFVLLYHLGLCNAGFLAVCGFFVISGYLLANTINSKDFNLKDYYLSKFKSLFLPLLIVVFTTVFVFRYVVDIPWVSIKQETLSVLFNYNNFFQISANSNYFIRSDASPFTHMWYISILIQIEFVLPLIIHLLNKNRKSLNKILLYVITCISIFAFIYIDNKYKMAVSYYNTFARLFSFLVGYSAYYIDGISSNNKLGVITLIVIVALFLVNNLAQEYYLALMIIVTLLSSLFILLIKDNQFKENKIVRGICKISYFVYLVQYPIIYIVEASLDIKQIERVIIEVLLIVVLSVIYYFGLNHNENKYKKIILYAISITTLLGVIGFVTCPDYAKQMDDLKKQLEYNQSILENKQAEYLEKIKDEQSLVINSVSEIDEALNNIDETVKNAKITLIGDSIMLGGSFNLDEYFTNYYCDAKGSRNGFLGYETLSDLLDLGVVGDYIVIHLGTNSGLELEEVESISSLLTDKKVLWLTVTNGWRKGENPMLTEYCNSHENHYLADWYNFSLNHKEYFVTDGLHLSIEGRHAYDQFIFDNLKEIIKQDLSDKKDEILNNYNNEKNNTISFYGNDLLINLYDKLDNDYLYYTDNNFDFDSLYTQLKNNKDNLYLSKTIFILLDKSVTLNDNEIERLYELLNDNNVYIFAYNQKANDLSNILGKDCLLEDGIHLNDKGNEILINSIKQIIEKN